MESIRRIILCIHRVCVFVCVCARMCIYIYIYIYVCVCVCVCGVGGIYTYYVSSHSAVLKYKRYTVLELRYHSK